MKLQAMVQQLMGCLLTHGDIDVMIFDESNFQLHAGDFPIVESEDEEGIIRVEIVIGGEDE